MTYVAILRGVNVAKTWIKMAELSRRLSARGYSQVRTYIQSGNVIFESAKEPGALARDLRKIIDEEFGYDVAVILKTKSQLKKIIAANPFSVQDPAKVAVAFLAGVPAKENVARLAAFSFGPDRWVLRGDVVFLHCPNGFGRTKLTNARLEDKLKLEATSRNWRTVNEIFGLVAGG